MTNELLALLRRVEAAGGPVNVTGNRIDVEMSDDVVALDAQDWPNSSDEALLIHALQVDVGERGADFGLSFSQVEQEYKAVVFLPGGTMHEADDDMAAIAMTRAWLGAFEGAQ